MWDNEYGKSGQHRQREVMPLVYPTLYGKKNWLGNTDVCRQAGRFSCTALGFTYLHILPLYHKSGLLGLYAALTVSDLFFVVFVEFYGVF